MADLSVKIGKLALKNPVMTASGTFGYGLEFQDFMPLDGIGGIIVKALPEKKSAPWTILCPTASMSSKDSRTP